MATLDKTIGAPAGVMVGSDGAPLSKWLRAGGELMALIPQSAPPRRATAAPKTLKEGAFPKTGLLEMPVCRLQWRLQVENGLKKNTRFADQRGPAHFRFAVGVLSGKPTVDLASSEQHV
jgi:hypothetical protein